MSRPFENELWCLEVVHLEFSKLVVVGSTPTTESGFFDLRLFIGKCVVCLIPL